MGAGFCVREDLLDTEVCRGREGSTLRVFKCGVKGPQARARSEYLDHTLRLIGYPGVNRSP